MFSKSTAHYNFIGNFMIQRSLKAVQRINSFHPKQLNLVILTSRRSRATTSGPFELPPVVMEAVSNKPDAVVALVNFVLQGKDEARERLSKERDEARERLSKEKDEARERLSQRERELADEASERVMGFSQKIEQLVNEKKDVEHLNLKLLLKLLVLSSSARHLSFRSQVAQR
jgi:hypothetical protein